jgi:hypothetical protein
MKNSIFIGTLLSGLFLFIAITDNAAVSAGSDRAPYKDYVSSGNYFHCRIPADWSVYYPGMGLSEEEKKVYGVTLTGPQNDGPLSPVISVHYYAPGNLLHKSMDVYIRRHTASNLNFETEGKSYGKVSEVEIAGRKAKIFERMDIRLVGGRVLHPTKMPVYEKFVIVPAKSGEGFYVLRLSVPVRIKDEYPALFEETVKSFLPGN